MKYVPIFPFEEDIFTTINPNGDTMEEFAFNLHIMEC